MVLCQVVERDQQFHNRRRPKLLMGIPEGCITLLLPIVHSIAGGDSVRDHYLVRGAKAHIWIGDGLTHSHECGQQSRYSRRYSEAPDGHPLTPCGDCGRLGIGFFGPRSATGFSMQHGAWPSTVTATGSR